MFGNIINYFNVSGKLHTILSFISNQEETIDNLNDNAWKQYAQKMVDKYVVENVESYGQQVLDRILAKLGDGLKTLGFELLDISVVVAQIIMIFFIYLLILGDKKRLHYLYYSAMGYVILSMLNVWLRL